MIHIYYQFESLITGRQHMIVSEGVLGFDHDCHSECDHVDIDLFVSDGIHLQEVVGFSLSVFALVDVV
jgi:hypothetical protein